LKQAALSRETQQRGLDDNARPTFSCHQQANGFVERLCTARHAQALTDFRSLRIENVIGNDQ
jgi:hypothetical protein